MDLHLRKVVHLRPATVTASFSRDGIEIEVGSIGIQHGSGATEHWVRGIDNVIPMREIDAQGIGKDCMRQFRAAWHQFSADPARLTEFLRERLG